MMMRSLISFKNKQNKKSVFFLTKFIMLYDMLVQDVQARVIRNGLYPADEETGSAKTSLLLAHEQEEEEKEKLLCCTCVVQVIFLRLSQLALGSGVILVVYCCS